MVLIRSASIVPVSIRPPSITVEPPEPTSVALKIAVSIRLADTVPVVMLSPLMVEEPPVDKSVDCITPVSYTHLTLPTILLV